MAASGGPYEFRADAPLRPPRAPASEAQPGAILVVDNGSYQCRAGWAGQPEPRVVFRALLHRPRAKARRARLRRAGQTPAAAPARVVPPLTRAVAPARRAQSLPDGASIVGDYDASLLRGVDPTRCTVRAAAGPC
jgi:actin-related protein